MTNNFHDLITRMANELDEYRRLLLDDCTVTHRLSNEARTALAEPGPERPTDEELLEMMPQPFRSDLAIVSRMAAHGAGPDIKPGLFRVSLNTGALDYARAVLARWGNPAPLPPAEGEVAELVRMLTGIAHWRRRGRPGECDPSPFDIRQADRLDRAAELLERQATACAICERERLHQSTRAADLEVERQAAPAPVPVNERLPGPKDCDAEGRCWFGTPGCNVWGASWVLRKRSHQRNGITSWLPAHALPLPEVNNG